MPVPSNISELSKTPANNSPAGTETPGTADDYLRAHAAFIATLNAADAAHVAAANPHPAYAPLASPSLTGAPTATTAAAGTNTKQIATTEFVQRALGSYAGSSNISAGGTIQPGNVGKVNIFESTAEGKAIYLPSLVGLPVGATIVIHGYGMFDYTIGPQGGQDILARGTVLTSLPMKGADSAVLYKESDIRWVLIGGTVQEAYSPRQASFLDSSGYQKLPSGLIIQWGVRTSVALNQTFNQITFPIAFHNSAANISATIGMSAPVGGNISPVVRNLVATGVQIAGDHATDTATGNIYWSAIGY